MGAGGKEGMEGFPRIFRSGVRSGTYAAEGERRSGIRLGGREKLGEIKSGVGEDFGQVEFVGKKGECTVGEEDHDWRMAEVEMVGEASDSRRGNSGGRWMSGVA